jgi:hypothetical protein
MRQQRRSLFSFPSLISNVTGASSTAEVKQPPHHHADDGGRSPSVRNHGSCSTGHWISFGPQPSVGGFVMAEGETVDSGEKPLNEFGYKQDLWRDGISIRPRLFLHVLCLFVTYGRGRFWTCPIVERYNFRSWLTPLSAEFYNTVIWVLKTSSSMSACFFHINKWMASCLLFLYRYLRGAASVLLHLDLSHIIH